MKTIKIVIACGGCGHIDTPDLAIMVIREDEITRIQELQKIVADNDLSEVRFTTSGVAYPDGNYEFCTPEIAISNSGFWIAAQFSAFEGDAEVKTRSVSIDDLSLAFSKAKDGDLIVLGDPVDEVCSDLYDNCQNWGLENTPIGYQVANEDSGEHWNNRASFEVLSYQDALEEYEQAKASGPGWELSEIFADTVEELTFV